MGYSLWGHKELDMTKVTKHALTHMKKKEGNPEVRGGGVACWGPRAGVPLTLHFRNMFPSSQILKANLG